MVEYDAAANSFRSYNLAIDVLRERCIRRGQIQPRDDHPDELRWAREGDRPNAELDTVKCSR